MNSMFRTHSPRSAGSAAAFFAVLALAASSSAAEINYPNFNNLSGLQLNGATAAINPAAPVLRLTNALWQSGSVFSTTAITLQNQNSFSTYFSFRITNPLGWTDTDGIQGADGLVFVVQTNSNTAGGAGGGIGYENIPNSVGIEFDTWNNGGWDDNNGNHVGINLSGNINSTVQTAVGTPMNNGAVWHSWVDYNGTTDLLEVRLAQTDLRPVAALLSHTVDLQTILGSPNAYVGFTSGTGAAGGNHDILSWTFRDAYRPVNNAPDGGATVALLAVGVAALAGLRRRFVRS